MSDPSERPLPHDGRDSGQPSPLDDALFDPFVPEKSYVQVGEDGPVVVDVLKTVENYDKAMLPELKSNNLKKGDRVAVSFDDKAEVEYEITDATPDRLDFGSDDVNHPRVKVVRVDDEHRTDMVIIGSSISPSGGLMTPGAVISGYHLVTWRKGVGQDVSSGTITDFTLRRPDDGGELHEVHLNQLRSKQETSPEFQGLVSQFEAIEKLLGETGFAFEQLDGDGFYRGFQGQTDTEFVYAARQGFGCAVSQMYEIYTYDAATSSLRALRLLPEHGVFQFATMGIDPVGFAKTGFNGDDWRSMRRFEPSNMHRGLDDSQAFVTYSWLDSGESKPMITIKTQDHGIAEKMRGENSDFSNVMPSAHVNISQAHGSLSVTPGERDYWIDAATYEEAIASETEVINHDGALECNIGELKLEVPSDPSHEIEEMVKTIRNVVSAKHHKRGSGIIEV